MSVTQLRLPGFCRWALHRNFGDANLVRGKQMKRIKHFVRKYPRISASAFTNGIDRSPSARVALTGCSTQDVCWCLEPRPRLSWSFIWFVQTFAFGGAPSDRSFKSRICGRLRLGNLLLARMAGAGCALAGCRRAVRFSTEGVSPAAACNRLPGTYPEVPAPDRGPTTRRRAAIAFWIWAILATQASINTYTRASLPSLYYNQCPCRR